MLYDAALLMRPELEGVYTSLLTKLGNSQDKRSVAMDDVLYNEAIRLLKEVEKDGIHVNDNLAKLDAMAALLAQCLGPYTSSSSSPSEITRRQIETEDGEQIRRPPNDGPLGIAGILQHIASYGSIVAAAALTSTSTVQRKGVPIAGVRFVAFHAYNSAFTQTIEGQRGIRQLVDVEEIHLGWKSSVRLPRLERVHTLELFFPRELHFDFPGLIDVEARLAFHQLRDFANSIRSSPRIRFFKITIPTDESIHDESGILASLPLPNVERLEMHTTMITHGIPWSSNLKSVNVWGQARINPPLTPQLRLFEGGDTVSEARNVKEVWPSLERFEGRLVHSQQLATFPASIKFILVTTLINQDNFQLRDDAFAHCEQLTNLDINSSTTIFSGFHRLPLSIRSISCFSNRQGFQNLIEALRNGFRPVQILFTCDTDEIFTRQDAEPLIELVDSSMLVSMQLRGWTEGVFKKWMGGTRMLEIKRRRI